MADPHPDLPGLRLAAGEDPLRAWSRRFPAAPKQAYVRFPRGQGDVPLGAVQRLARRAQVVVDAWPRDADDVLDLAVAGAHAVVAWVGTAVDVRAMAEAMSDDFLLGAQPATLSMARPIALELELPVLLETGPSPTPASPLLEGLHGYFLDLALDPLVLKSFGQWPAATDPAPDQPQVDDEGLEGQEGLEAVPMEDEELPLLDEGDQGGGRRMPFGEPRE